MAPKNSFEEIVGPGKRKKERNPENIILSAEEKEILTHVESLIWPKGSAQYLPSVVRTSSRNYRKFLKKFHRVLKKSRKRFPDGVEAGHTYNDLHQFIQKKLPESFLPASSYILGWLEAYHKKVIHWKGWNGKLRPFSYKSEEFQKEGCEQATEWFGNKGYKYWQQFMDLIDHED